MDKNLVKIDVMDEASICGISDIPQNLSIWFHVEIIGIGNVCLSHLGLLCRLGHYFLFISKLEKSNHCQTESTDNKDGLLNEGERIIFRELHAIKGLHLTSIQYYRCLV